MGSHFKDLLVWQKAMEMVTEVYKLTENFPKREVYSLTDQIRRAAVSVPSNMLKGRRITITVNFCTSCAIPLARLPKLRLSCTLRKISAT
jgi:four helix bundle protein